MRQLAFVRPGQLEWWNVPAPRLQADTDALVDRSLPRAVTSTSTSSPGTVRKLRSALSPHAPASRAWPRLPLPRPTLRRSVRIRTRASGRGTRDRDAVTRLQPSLRVIVPFQISCGACALCARGITASCSTVPPCSMYGLGRVGGVSWGGLIADCVRVPFADHMLIPIREGVDPVAIASTEAAPTRRTSFHLAHPLRCHVCARTARRPRQLVST